MLLVSMKWWGKYQPTIDGEIIQTKVINLYGSHHGEGVFFLKVKIDKNSEIVTVPDTLDIYEGSNINLRKKTPKYIGASYYEYESTEK